MTALHQLVPRAALAAGAAAVLALLAVGAAWAHATIVPATGLAGGELYALSVPNEIDGETTTAVTLTVPDGFTVGQFEPSPGWERTVERTGAGHEGAVRAVTWTAVRGGSDEGALFQFTGRSSSAGTFTFAVAQTYSDGTVVDWAGEEGSELPAPVVTTKSALSGGGTSALALAALALAGAALAVGIVALVRRGRPGAG
jgi:uncharacterized protein YcnI